MRRKRTNRNNGVLDRKGKGVQKVRHVFIGDRNRASPAPIIKLYKSLTPAQRKTIIAMGHEAFLDNKCEHLHNPVIHWFTKCYQPARRAFVIPRRGVIPLTAESVHLMMGLPQGHLVVKYYVDYDMEADISARLFPGGSSRPKVSDIGKMIENYKRDDDTFKELWMLFSVSIVVAPTTDTKMSNKCYPMLADIGQAHDMNLCKFIAEDLHENLSKGKYTKGCLLYCMLRYFSALDTDHLELELGSDTESGDQRFTINRWSKVAIDVIADMDAQQYDSTTFGALLLKDEFKDSFSQETDLLGGSEGFESWMNSNIHPTCTPKNFASSLNGLLSNLVQELTDCTEEENNNDIIDDGIDESNEDVDNDASSSEGEDEDRLRAPDGTNQDAPRTEVANKRVGQTPIKGVQAEGSSSASVPPMHSQIRVPYDSDMDISDGGTDYAGFLSDSPNQCTQQDDEEIRGSAASLDARLSNLKQKNVNFTSAELDTHNKIKLIVAKEIGIPIHVRDDDMVVNKLTTGINVSRSPSTNLKNLEPKKSGGKNVRKEHDQLGCNNDPAVDEKSEVPENSVMNSEGKTPCKRKNRSLVSTTFIRKSPRIEKNRSHSQHSSPSSVSDRKSMNNSEDGKSTRTAFVVSPTVSKAAIVYEKGKKKSSLTNDGKSMTTAIALSPTVPALVTNTDSFSGGSKSSVDTDEKNKSSAIPISPMVNATATSNNAASIASINSSIKGDDGKTKSTAIAISPMISKE